MFCFKINTFNKHVGSKHIVGDSLLSHVFVVRISFGVWQLHFHTAKWAIRSERSSRLGSVGFISKRAHVHVKQTLSRRC